MFFNVLYICVVKEIRYITLQIFNVHLSIASGLKTNVGNICVNLDHLHK